MKKIFYILNLFLACSSGAWASRRTEIKLLPYVSFLIHECGVWHWEYAFEIENVIQFGEEELYPLEDPRDSIMVQKALKYLRKHPDRYDYIFVNDVPFFFFRRHLYILEYDLVNPRLYFKYKETVPTMYHDNFVETPRVAYDSLQHVLIDASRELRPMIGSLQRESRQNEADTIVPSWIAIEYNYETGKLYNYRNGQELTPLPEIHTFMMSRFSDLKAKFPQVFLLRFCLYCSEANFGL